MGTNFYTVKEKKHVGKRSAAGPYCWNCRTTLCESEEMIHTGGQWEDVCPLCGQKKLEESLETSTTGRELGCNKSKPGEKTGVVSASSFTWAMKPNILMREEPKIVDEYGDVLTFEEFLMVLDECPIQYYKSIGEMFS